MCFVGRGGKVVVDFLGIEEVIYDLIGNQSRPMYNIFSVDSYKFIKVLIKNIELDRNLRRYEYNAATLFSCHNS